MTFGVTDKNRWVALFNSRAFWVGIAAASVPFLKEIFDVDLSVEQTTGIFVGLGSILVYLLNKDRLESQERKEILRIAADDPKRIEASLKSLETLLKK